MNRGVALITILLLIAIISTLVLGIFIQSNVSNRTDRYVEALGLAEMGLEAARGWAQDRTAQGLTIPPITDSRILCHHSPCATVSLHGQEVVFKAKRIQGKLAEAIPTSVPVYDSLGRLKEKTQIGYFAFVLVGGPPIEIYGLGAIGPKADQIIEVRELHEIVRPSSAIQDFFAGLGSQDNSLSKSQAPPKETTSSLQPGQNSLLSAHQVSNEPNGNSELSLKLNSIAPLKRKSPPLPPATGEDSLINTMQRFLDAAKQSGLFLWDPEDTKLVAGSTWVPEANWNPELAPDKIHIKLNSSGETCTDGSKGDIRILNGLPRTILYRFNGQPGILHPVGDSREHCFNSTMLGQHVIYTDGNFSIYADPQNGYIGTLSFVGPGKITVSGQIASKSFLEENAGKFPPPENYRFKSSIYDVGALVTPYQILLRPTPGQVEGFKSSMVLMQIGQPKTLPLSWNQGLPVLNLDGNFTIKVGGEAFPVLPLGCPMACRYQYIYLYGNQLFYTRTANWYRYYAHVYEQFDTNLLKCNPAASPILNAGFHRVDWHEVNRNTGEDMTYNNL